MDTDQLIAKIGKFADLAVQGGVTSTLNVSDTIMHHIHDTTGIVLTRLGNGRFSAVFELPGDNTRVMKIGLNPERQDASAYDDPWLGYAALAMSLPPSPYLPRIESIRLFDNTYIAIMERLDIAMGDLRKPKDVAAGKLPRQFLNDWSEAMRDAISRRFAWEHTVGKLQAKYPEYFDADGFAYYVKLFRKIGRFDDLHEENVMLRGKKLIITDPYWKWDSILHKIDFRQYAVKINGVDTVDAERMSNGQNRVSYLYRGAPISRERALEEVGPLWAIPFDAVQPISNGIQSVLSSVRYEPIPKGTDILTRLQEAA